MLLVFEADPGSVQKGLISILSGVRRPDETDKEEAINPCKITSADSLSHRNTRDSWDTSLGSYTVFVYYSVINT